MNITFDELRKLKHSLPTGSINRIADQLNIKDQTVRNVFGAKKTENGQLVGSHLDPGPSGGIFNLDAEAVTIVEAAWKILHETNIVSV